jgi:hypothetical protein
LRGATLVLDEAFIWNKNVLKSAFSHFTVARLFPNKKNLSSVFD